MFETYFISDNESIQDVANKFNTSVQFLEVINGGNVVEKGGREILVPKFTSNIFDYYIIDEGDTLYKIAMQKNINPQLLAELNGINVDDYIYPKQVLLVPKPGLILYITAEGDTLNEIASGIDADMLKLVEENKRIYLQPGQLIVYINK